MEAIQQATNGVNIAPEDDVEPDSDRCVMISTRSSVKEMIAPGMYAVLTPLIAGFMVGGRAYGIACWYYRQCGYACYSHG